MTITQILSAVLPHKECSIQTVRRLIEKVGAKPLGTLDERPQRFPPDTAQKILVALGVNGTNGHDTETSHGRVPSLKRLQQVRKSARRGK